MITSIFPLVDELYSTLVDMERSKLVFHQTGSRFFNRAADESDYDFFVQDAGDSIRTELISFGFAHFTARSGYARDSLTIDVYRKICKDGHIDIQIVSDAALKMKAQALLAYSCPDFVSGKDCKDIDPVGFQRRRIWEMAYNQIILEKELGELRASKQ